MGVHWKIQFSGGVHKNNNMRGLPRKEELGQFANWRGGLGKKEGGGGLDTPMHTLWIGGHKTLMAKIH